MSYAIAIPAYNAERTIAETLDSVLAQTVQPFEIVVLDDGSSDATAAIAGGHPAAPLVISMPNSGCGTATTHAIHATTAPMVATLDADDIWLPEKMACQLARLEASGPKAISFTRARQFRHGEVDQSSGLERDSINRSTMVLHRATFDQVGPIIDPPGGAGDMVDWLGRARAAGLNLDVLPKVLMLRRIIEGSMTYGAKEDFHRGYLSVARAAILRRRQKEKED
jgi:hypothetical protein